ncbi:hypothetical protein NM208_g3199 [Fusarium decemcellulare]|uniref:Uncharacterized protein n=1 Tax=Fusarium decemcellulare TaxID=57161 RepID=A0ACC1SQ49_9HYPO|nr:hypothetical protein NM208_g3199 [Fusarium decemcellulare]
MTNPGSCLTIWADEDAAVTAPQILASSLESPPVRGACGLKLGDDELEAVRYFRDSFAPLYITKNPDYSVFNILIHLAMHDSLVMHMVVAIGSRGIDFRRISRRRACSLLEQDGSHHSKYRSLGIRHYSDALRKMYSTVGDCAEAGTTDLDSLTSALVLMIMGYQVTWTGTSLILKHHYGEVLRRVPLASLAADSIHRPSTLMRTAKAGTGRHLSQYSARLLTRISGMDASAASFGLGGQVTGTLYKMMTGESNERSGPRLGPMESLAWLESYSGPLYRTIWGDQYPADEIVDDLENRIVFDLLGACGQLRYLTSELTTVLFHAGGAAASQAVDNVEAAIRQTGRRYMDLLESASRLTIDTDNSHRLIQNMRWVVPIYYTEIIEFLRLTRGRQPVPSMQQEHQKTLQEIMALAVQAHKHGGDVAMLRIARPLFIVALESNDELHLTWLLERFQGLGQFGEHFIRARDFLERTIGHQLQDPSSTCTHQAAMTQHCAVKDISDAKAPADDDAGHELESLADGAILGRDLTPEEDQMILRKVDRWLLPVMASAYVFQFLDKTALSYSAILGLQQDLHLVGKDYSWSSAIYYFGYMIATYPVAGVLLVRLPVAKVLSASMVIWGGVLMLTAACRNSGGLLAARFFLGVAETAMAPGLSMIIAMWYKRSEQPLRQGAWFLGNTCAGLLGGLISYGLGHIDSISPWKFFGGVTIAFSVVIFLLLPDTPLNARFLSTEERALAIARVEGNMTGIKNNTWKRYQVVEALCDPNGWFLVLAYLASTIPNNGLITFSTIIINGFGFSVLKTLLLNMMTFAFQLVFVLISAIGSSRLPNSRLYFMIFNLLVSIAGAVMVRELDNDHKWARVMGGALAIAFTANFPMTMAMMSSNFGGFTKKTTVSAMIFIAYCVSNIVGPNLFFPREAPGYKSGFLAIMICFAIAIVLCIMQRIYLVRVNKKRDLAGDELDVPSEALNLMDKTDKEIPQFRYVY